MIINYYKSTIKFCNYKISTYLRVMLRFLKYQDGDDMMVINPVYVAHVHNDPNKKESVVTMCDGRRYVLPVSDCIKLSEELEKLANYGGC